VTQDLLAERLGIATRNLQRIESGRQNLTLGTIERIAAALGVPPESLLPRIERRVFANRSNGVPPSIVPVIPLRAAAGFLTDPAAATVEGWCMVEEVSGAPHFVARMHEPGLAPVIPSGAYALFDARVEETCPRDVLLCRLTDGGAAAPSRRPRASRKTRENGSDRGSEPLTLLSLRSALSGHGGVLGDGVHPVARFIRVLD
jgi:DNA-binding Xre family transcriptional regulator